MRRSTIARRVHVSVVADTLRPTRGVNVLLAGGAVAMYRCCLLIAIVVATLLAPGSSLAIGPEQADGHSIRVPVRAGATATVLMHDGSAGSDFRFEPQTLTVLAGTTVTWKNVS